VILAQRDEHNQPALQYLLTGRDPGLGLNLRPFGPIVLENGPGGYFSDLYRQIENLPVETEQDKAEATERLKAIGSTLFTELLPADLRTLLWQLRDRIRTVWVQSAEPYVPWELCRLQGTAEDGSIVEGDFFCEAFALTRWIPGVGRLPELRLSNVGVIVPGDSRLVSALAEKDILHELARAGRAVADIAPTYLDVRRALASAEYDGIHFSGHGRFPDKSDPEGRDRARGGQEATTERHLGRCGEPRASPAARLPERVPGRPAGAGPHRGRRLGERGCCATARRRSWGRTGR
jgi:hypothetical protein